MVGEVQKSGTVRGVEIQVIVFVEHSLPDIHDPGPVYKFSYGGSEPLRCQQLTRKFQLSAQVHSQCDVDDRVTCSLREVMCLTRRLGPGSWSDCLRGLFIGRSQLSGRFSFVVGII